MCSQYAYSMTCGTLQGFAAEICSSNPATLEGQPRRRSISAQDKDRCYKTLPSYEKPRKAYGNRNEVKP